MEEVLHVMTPAEWGKPIGVDEKWIQFVDENVKASRFRTRKSDDGFCLTGIEFPSDTKIESIRPHGASYWTRTAKISTQMADGTPRSYFLKVSHTRHLKSRINLNNHARYLKETTGKVWFSGSSPQ